MKIIKFFKYLIEFTFIIFFFIIFKIIGIKLSTYISGKIFSIFGPLFRSKETINKNLRKVYPEITESEIKRKSKSMWEYYGKIFAEYPFLSHFRNDKSKHKIQIIGEDEIDIIRKTNENVIFISGHFDNFELMAMILEKKEIKLGAIYRPLNNYLMNGIMEFLRKKYICKNQIKKGRSSTRDLLNLFKKGYSIALMIDQRVSEGLKINFFGEKAYTTTIPAQFVRKFNCKVVPLHIEREDTNNFKITISKPFKFNKNDSLEKITEELNIWLEDVIKNSRSNWIWSHNRWK